MGRKSWVPVLGTVAALAAVWVVRDYRSWVALGPGGVPHTLGGYYQVSKLRLQKIDPTDTTMLRTAAQTLPQSPVLGALPDAGFARPGVDPHPIPHRLMNGQASPEIIDALRAMFDTVVAADDERVMYARSNFEKHNNAATARVIASQHVDAIKSHGEIGHVHPSDGSMHFVLHPLDAEIAIRAGWGELHPLSGSALLPSGYLMAYPPQRVEQVEVIRRILLAAIEYVTAPPAPAL